MRKTVVGQKQTKQNITNQLQVWEVEKQNKKHQHTESEYEQNH